MADHGVQAVVEFEDLLKEMLLRTDEVKPTNTVEPPLVKADLGAFLTRIDPIFPPTQSLESKKPSQYAIIETAVRDTFNDLLATTNIDSPEFVKLWNLLDIISILSDDEQCDPALLFWLVEELLDSQTIAGCRTIFDYLESRRDKITAKHFPQKQLVILRSCNELLRRLSRAEDTAFCGRVFIFLFQSFPLGDKSSVNLRGEFHTENVTTFDEPPSESMDVDSETKAANSNLQLPDNDTSKRSDGSKSPNSRAVDLLSIDKLYPVFWAMQQSLSQPKNLFEKETLAQFKTAVEATRAMFESVQSQSSGRSTRATDPNKQSSKRKRGEGDDDLANSFNPKYLTSRDLFELEISDLSFRRHVLVQIVVILDFLLSLGPKSRAKLSQITLPANPNKSVMYVDQSLSEEDEIWAEQTKTKVMNLLMTGFEGPHFHRMIESVLSRDKNWSKWKIENCPPISKDGITPGEYNTAKAAAKRATLNRRIVPLAGSLDLKFLSESNAQAGLERLKDPSRYEIPSFKSFKSKMELDDMDIDMANNDEDRQAAIEAKASKSWRALRVASATNLVAFDKIERSDKIEEIFLDKPQEPIPSSQEVTVDAGDTPQPKDRRAIIFAGPMGVGKSTIIKMLLAKHPQILERNVSHTTRIPGADEVDGKDYNFVTNGKYSTMRDADEFLEHSSYNGNDRATSRDLVEGIIARGKVPVLEMEHQSIQQVRENNFVARFLFIEPASMADLEARLRKGGDLTDEQIRSRLTLAQDDIDQSKLEGAYDKVFVNDNLEETFKMVEAYIFGTEGPSKDATAVLGADVEMADGTALEANSVANEEGAAQ